MSSEMCKRCINHTVCMRDKNIIGDVFVAGHPDYFDNKKLFERFIEREKAGFPCDTFCGWIPCSERLPEKPTKVLCCRNNKSIAIMYFNPILTTRYPKGFSIDNSDGFSWRQDNVIAWMPLPEPYEVEQ